MQLWLTCPLSLTLYQKEALCQIPSSFTLYPWVFIMPMSPEGAGGWLVVCSRAAVEYAAFCRGVSQWVCVCERARERSRLRYCLLCLLSHGQIAEQKGRLAGGHTLPSSGLHCRWYAENELSYLDAERPNLTWWLRHAQDHTETFFVVVVVFPQTF